jgi:hypothetical protein
MHHTLPNPFQFVAASGAADGPVTELYEATDSSLVSVAGFHLDEARFMAALKPGYVLVERELLGRVLKRLKQAAARERQALRSVA